MLETTEHDKAYDTLRSKTDKSEKAKGVLRGAGYARGGGVGAKAKRYAHGGKVGGDEAKSRPDKMSRGGSKPSGHHTRVNINVGAGQAEKQQALQQGMQIGAKMAQAKMGAPGGAPGGMSPRPMAGAPMQARPAPGGPGGGPPGVPPTMGAATGGRAYKRGGKVGPAKVQGVPHLKAGAGGAKGRLEKIKEYGGKKN